MTQSPNDERNIMLHTSSF